MPSKNEVLAEELRTLADDLKQVYVTVTTDPKEQRRKELQWRLLYGGLSAVFAVVARKLAAKGYGILTGEEPPTKRAAKQQQAQAQRVAQGEPEAAVVPESEQETAVGV